MIDKKIRASILMRCRNACSEQFSIRSKVENTKRCDLDNIFVRQVFNSHFEHLETSIYRQSVAGAQAIDALREKHPDTQKTHGRRQHRSRKP
jgi:hypothetical protein